MRYHRKLDKPQRVLLVIAPTLYQCVKTAKDFGIEPGLSETLRTVSTAYKLRGWSRGTPFIAQDRANWPATLAGRDLDIVLDVYVRQGRLRIANQRDLKAAGAGVFEERQTAE